MYTLIIRRSRFKYLKDPLFLAVVLLYFINRYVIKDLTIGKIGFFNNYFNALICIPFCLPIVLFLTRVVRLRGNDEPPGFYEIFFYLLMWSFFFEYLAPMYGRYLNHPVADPWDVVFYVLGGSVAGIYWNFAIRKPKVADNSLSKSN
jgi:hypothetical protein